MPDIKTMGQDIVILFILIIVMVGVYIAGVLNRKKRLAYIQELLKEEWGVGHEKEYTYEEFERISHYYQNRQKHGKRTGKIIDDITWNDLEMDEVFLQMNHTYSTIGEEYLYDMLRRPAVDENELKERERVITFFSQNEEARRLLQTTFYEIGKTSKVAFGDYIYQLSEVEKGSNMPHYLAIIAFFAATVLAVFQIAIGVIALIAVIIWNINSYYKEKQKMDAYISSFQYVMKLLAVSDEFDRIELPEIENYIREIREKKKKFKAFRKRSMLVASGKSMGGSILDSLLEYVRMLFHVDLIKFNSMLEELKKNLPELETILENLGLLDSLIAIASYRESLPYYCIPKLQKQKNAYIRIHKMYHPLIENPIANTIEEERGVLITGSNASGKSTFLKTAAISAVLAQTIHTCPAEYYESCFFQIYSSMALKDNLQGNESYYIVEIKSLKRILNYTEEELPVLCFVDEVLRGTNTIERISASAQVLKSLARKNVLCFAATHDIELTHLLEPYYSNYHFEEEVVGNDILFHYILYKGRAVSRNAIKLLGIIGYDQKIIEDAEKTAKQFAETGVWNL